VLALRSASDWLVVRASPNPYFRVFLRRLFGSCELDTG
jgi:hypothetical protein